MDLVGLLVNLASGAVGGNAAGALVKKISLGTLGNSVAGILGGGLGGVILNALGLGGATELAADGGAAAEGAGNILGNILSGGVGGGALLGIVGMIKQAMGGSK